jgi:Holliday junction resolvase
VSDAKPKDPVRVAAGKRAKRRGKVGERELAKVLREHGFEEAKRGQQFRGGGDSPDVVGIPGVHVECKRVEKFDPYDWMAQAVRDADEGKTPAVIHRRNHKDWIVILRLEDYAALIKGEKTGG